MKKTYSNNVLNFIRQWAYDDYDNNQIFKVDEYNEFAKICKEKNIEADETLWNFYWDCVYCRRDAMKM